MQNERKLNTDIEALSAMTDDDIDYSDLAPFTEEFLAAVDGFAEIPEKELISISIDRPVIDFFRRTGKAVKSA